MPHTNIEIPERLPLYPQKEMVPFPYMIFPLYVDERELRVFSEADNYEKYVAIVLLRPDAVGASTLADISGIGTLCRVNQIKKLGDGRFKVTLEGMARLRILGIEQTTPIMLANCELVREFVEKSLVSEALVQSLNALLKISLSHGKPLPDDVMKMIDYIDNPARLSDLVALYVNLPSSDLQELLETVDPLDRLKKV